MLSPVKPATTTDTMEDALHRLSKKPGVKAWIMLDRTSGAVIKTNGQIAAIRPARSSTSTTNPATSLPTPTGGSFSAEVTTGGTDNETQSAQELGSMVWGFLSTAGSLVQEMDTEVRGFTSVSNFSMTRADRFTRMS